MKKNAKRKIATRMGSGFLSGKIYSKQHLAVYSTFAYGEVGQIRPWRVATMVTRPLAAAQCSYNPHITFAAAKSGVLKVVPVNCVGSLLNFGDAEVGQISLGGLQ